ncbi:hypothetical protein CDAR_205511 [Caerostris darwini]|uniref:Uncharacterized protein n=1 Tax=Caerostris darwini TaxID=1538125 RepID=A0AAV4WUQ2_9ARAC|nr:hypothetical protein CDAR_205511 [Caerostris darwini]
MEKRVRNLESLLFFSFYLFPPRWIFACRGWGKISAGGDIVLSRGLEYPRPFLNAPDDRVETYRGNGEEKKRAQRCLFSPPSSHNSFLGALSFTPHLELSSAPPDTSPTPAIMYHRQQKIRFQKIFGRHRPKARNSLSPHLGVGGGFSQMAIVNQIFGGRSTLHGKTGVSSRITPQPRKTLKESGVPDR